MMTPVYISETSPKEHRGMLTSIVGQGYTLGLLVSLSMNVGFSRFNLGWRVPYMIRVPIGLVYTIGMMFAPHSPR
jgi:predicted MFS family arabinose efflux permease